MVAKDHDYENPEEDEFDEERVAFGKDSGTDKALFAMLKEPRKTKEKKMNLPP